MSPSRPIPPSLRLLAFRARALKRRFAGHPGVALLALLVVGLGALSLAALGSALAAAGLAETTVRDQVFWLGTLAALIYSYTSFEVFFRAKDTRLLSTLPLSGAHRFDDLFARALFLHLPLVAPHLAYALALALDPAPEASAAALYTVVVGLTQFFVGLCLAIALHLYAGRSLLTKGSELRRLLAGAAVPDDAALLVYAPALGLFGTLVLGIFIDLAFRDAIFRGKATLLGPVLLVAAAIATLSVARARRLARDHLHLILPRFSEVDVPPPYRDDGVRKHVPGEALARLLPPPARPYFLRDIRQLRRRHRLDRVLLWVFFAATLKLAHDATRSPALPSLSALAFMNGILIVAAFRLRGELASRALELTLPQRPRDELAGRLLASAHHPFVALALATLATLTTGDLGAAASVLGLGLPLTLAIVGLSHACARLGAERPGLAATLWRIALASSIATLGGLV